METEARHPVHREEAPAGFRRVQLLLIVIAAVLVLGAFIWAMVR